MVRILAYTFDADVYTVRATKAAWKAGYLKRPDWVTSEAVYDEHGLPDDLIDSEGNRVHPVFSTSENAYEDLEYAEAREAKEEEEEGTQ